MIATIIAVLLALFAVVTIIKCIRIVPQQSAFIVERLGKFHATLDAGLHILIPFVDRVAYRVPLQEIPMDTDPKRPSPKTT